MAALETKPQLCEAQSRPCCIETSEIYNDCKSSSQLTQVTALNEKDGSDSHNGMPRISRPITQKNTSTHGANQTLLCKSKINSPVRLRSGPNLQNARQACANKPSAKGKPDLKYPESFHPINKTDCLSRPRSNFKQRTGSPQFQQNTSLNKTNVSKSAACSKIISSTSSPRIVREKLKEGLGTKGHVSKSNRPRSAFLPQDSPSQLLSEFEKQPNLDKPFTPQGLTQRIQRRLLGSAKTNQKESIVKCKKDHNVTARASPPTTMLVSPNESGECAREINDSGADETNQASVTELEVNLVIASASSQCSEPSSWQPYLEHPGHKRPDNFSAKDPNYLQVNYSHARAKTDLSQLGCGSKYLKKYNTASSKYGNVACSSSKIEILQAQEDADTCLHLDSRDVGLLHPARLPSQPVGLIRRCEEISSQVSNRFPSALCEQRRGRAWEEHRRVHPQSPVSPGASKFKEGVRRRGPASATLSENYQRLKKHINPVRAHDGSPNFHDVGLEEARLHDQSKQNMEESQPHSESKHRLEEPWSQNQSRHASSPQAATREKHRRDQRSSPLLLKKSASPSLSEGKRKNLKVSSPYAVGKQISPPTQKINLPYPSTPSLKHSAGQVKRPQISHQQCVNLAAVGDSPSANKKIPYQLREFEKSLHQGNRKVEDQELARRRLTLRPRSVNKAHNPRVCSATRNLSDISLDKSHYIESRKRLVKASLNQARPARTKSRSSSRGSPLTHRSASFSLSADISDMDISNVTPRGEKGIFLTVRPRTSAVPCSAPKQPQSSILEDLGNLKSGLHQAESAANESIISEAIEKHLWPTEAAGNDYQDKDMSILHWLEATSFSKLSIQGSEEMSPVGISPNLVSFQEERSSMSITTKLYRENDRSSPLDISCDVTNTSLLEDDHMRSGLWLPRCSPSRAYDNLSISAAHGSLPSSCWPLRGAPCAPAPEGGSRDLDESRFPPGSPKKMAAMTAAGHKPAPRRASRYQGLKQRFPIFHRKGFWADSLLYFCALLLTLELVVVAFLWYHDTLPQWKNAGSSGSNDAIDNAA